jgi:hypothetical protein
MQPIGIASDGFVRFRANAVIRWLQDNGHINLNRIHVEAFPAEDVEQFYQLLGYSVSGYGDLSFVRKKTVEATDAEAERILAERKAKRAK